MNSFIITFTLALCITAGTAWGQKAPAAFQNGTEGGSFQETRTILSPLAKRVDDYLTRSVPFGFSGAVLVAQNDRIVLVNAWDDPSVIDYLKGVIKERKL